MIANKRILSLLFQAQIISVEHPCSVCSLPQFPADVNARTLARDRPLYL